MHKTQTVKIFEKLHGPYRLSLNLIFNWSVCHLFLIMGLFLLQVSQCAPVGARAQPFEASVLRRLGQRRPDQAGQRRQQWKRQG